MKTKSYEYFEAMMFKSLEDDQNGLESDLMRQVRQSLEAQEKRLPEPLDES